MVMEEKMGKDINEKQGIINTYYLSHWEEFEILNHLSKALNLNNSYFNDLEDFRKYVTRPDFLGRTIMRLPSGYERENFMGLSYVPNDTQCKDGMEINGFILDNTGIGIINGVESVINGNMRLNFARRNINSLALIDKDIAARYDLFLPREEKTFIGEFKTPEEKISIEMYKNIIPSEPTTILISYYLNEYYNMFVTGSSLRPEF